MATNYADFIPVSISREVLESVGERESAVMRLARVIQMPSGLTSVPVVSVAPDASFVTPAYGGRKPVSTIEWTSQRIIPEEIAVTLAIPNAFLDDAGFPVWESVRGEIAKAFARCFDSAALYGTGAPASYPAGGITAPAWAEQMAGDADPVKALNQAFAAVEDNGLEVDGVLGGPGLRGLMRGMMVGTEAQGTPGNSIYGVELATTPVWVKGAGPSFNLALVGDYDYVVVGIREDIRYDLSEDGVLTDGLGAVTVNAFQDDSTLMRAYMRVGIVVGTPLGADGNTVQKPLALAKTTAVTGLSADAFDSREPAGGTEAEERRAEGLAERDALRAEAAAAQEAREAKGTTRSRRSKAAE